MVRVYATDNLLDFYDITENSISGKRMINCTRDQAARVCYCFCTNV